MEVTAYRESTWFDMEKQKEVFGIKAKVDGKWINTCDNNGPLFFDTPGARDAKLKELNAALLVEPIPYADLLKTKY